LTADQRKQIQSLTDNAARVQMLLQRENSFEFRAPPAGSLQNETLQKLNKATEDKLAGLLTKDQAAKLKEMLGEPFKGPVFVRGGSMGGGGFARSPEERWNQYTGGKPVWRRSEITDPNTLRRFDLIAGMVGSTNGEITKEQYLAMSQRSQQGAPPAQPPAPGAAPGGLGAGTADAWAENLFRRLDKNGDGLLNYDELPEELRAERDKWDENKGGLISLEEFKAYFQARLQQWQAQRAQAGVNLPGFAPPP
jgi:hypothetical protein